MDTTDVCREIWRCGGTATAGELSARGRPLRRALASGRVVRLSRGVYALSDRQPAVLAAAGLHGVVSHTSAAQLWMLELVSAPVRPHVTVRRNRKLSPLAARHVSPHWSDLPLHDVRGLVTSPLRTVVDCARTLPFPEGLAVGDSALRRGLVTQRELLERTAGMRGAGSGAARRVARHVSADAANPFESALRGIAIEAGVTGLVPQVTVETRSGRVRPDLVDLVLRMIGEADSFAWHGRRDQLAADCRRYDDLVADGWTVLRFAWEQVMFDREWVAAVLVDTAVALRGRTDVQKSARAAPRAPAVTVGTSAGPPSGNVPAPRDGGRQNSTVAKVPTRSKPTAS